MVIRGMKQSAPGPSGLRADHILLAFLVGSSDSLIMVLRSIIEGSAPRWLVDARLLAIPKPAGGIRPIAVGEVLRRIAAAALMRDCMSSLQKLVRQFITRRDGCLAVSSLTRAALENDNTCCALSINLRNAFNSVSREAVLNASRDTALAAYTQWAYGLASRLRYGDHIINSCSGVQQGDPVGPVLFAIAIAPVLQTARLNFPNEVIDLWYADDGCLLGRAADLLTAYRTLEPLFAAINLSINSNKCALWHNDSPTN